MGAYEAEPGPFLEQVPGPPTVVARIYCEGTAQAIDDAAKAAIDAAGRRATDTPVSSRAFRGAVRRRCRRRGTLSGDQVRALPESPEPSRGDRTKPDAAT